MNSYEQPLRRLAAHASTRTTYAEEARRRSLDTGLLTIDNYVIGALSLARAVQETFPDDLGTSLPTHLAYALQAEITGWERLHTSLTEYGDAQPTPADEPAYAGNVRSFLTLQLALLDTEQELLTSCLVDQYMARIDVLVSRMNAVKL